jgi:hypothetical protein
MPVVGIGNKPYSLPCHNTIKEIIKQKTYINKEK